MIARPNKWLQQIVQILSNITGLRIPTGRRQTSWLFTSMVEDLNSGLPWINPASGQGGLELGASESQVLHSNRSTTLPPVSLSFILHCFKLIIIHYHTQKQKKIKFKSRIKIINWATTYNWFNKGCFGHWEFRLRVVCFSSGIVERMKRERTCKSPLARMVRSGGEREKWESSLLHVG